MPGLSRRALARGWLLPLIVATLTHTAVRAVARYEGQDPGRNRTWVHWDAYRYIDIARRGYHEARRDPLSSNTGWFPGYPLLIRAVSEATGTGLARAGRVVSACGLLGFLTVLSASLLPVVPWPRRALALLLAAFVPGWVYFHAVFPQSTLLLFTLGSVALAARRRFALAGLAGALAAATYPTGVVVAVPLGLLAAREGPDAWRRLRALALAPGIACLGLAAVAAFYQVQVGHWDAYARFQGHLGAGLHNPAAVLFEHLSPLARLDGSSPMIVALDAAVASLLLLLAAVAAWRHRSATRALDTGLLLYAAVLWLLVNAAGPGLTLHRQAATLACLVPVLARLPSPALAALLAILVPLGLAMARLFFLDVLV